jgi:hypothetical protein
MLPCTPCLQSGLNPTDFPIKILFIFVI